MSRPTLIRELLQLLLTHQRRNRYVGSAFGTELQLAEAFILLCVEQGYLTIKEIVAVLKIPRSSVSRYVQALVAKNLVSVDDHHVDRRAVKIALRTEGIELLHSYHQKANESLLRFLGNLSEQERYELTALDRRFSDGLGVAPFEIGRAVHPLRSQIARHTIGLGLLTKGIFGEGLFTSVEWHILALLREHQEGLTIQALKAALDLTPSYISRAVRDLRLRGSAICQKGHTDRREALVQIDPLGLADLERLEARAASLLEVGLSLLSDAEIQRFVSLFGQFVGGWASGQTILATDGVEFRAARITSTGDLADARENLILSYLAQGKIRDIGEHLFVSGGWCFGLRREREFIAGFELVAKGRTTTLVNLFIRERTIEPQIIELFVECCLKRYITAQPACTISVGTSSPLREEITAIIERIQGRGVDEVVDRTGK